MTKGTTLTAHKITLPLKTMNNKKIKIKRLKKKKNLLPYMKAGTDPAKMDNGTSMTHKTPKYPNMLTRSTSGIPITNAMSL